MNPESSESTAETPTPQPTASAHQYDPTDLLIDLDTTPEERQFALHDFMNDTIGVLISSMLAGENKPTMTASFVQFPAVKQDPQTETAMDMVATITATGTMAQLLHTLLGRISREVLKNNTPTPVSVLPQSVIDKCIAITKVMKAHAESGEECCGHCDGHCSDKPLCGSLPPHTAEKPPGDGQLLHGNLEDGLEVLVAYVGPGSDDHHFLGAIENHEPVDGTSRIGEKVECLYGDFFPILFVESGDLMAYSYGPLIARFIQNGDEPGTFFGEVAWVTVTEEIAIGDKRRFSMDDFLTLTSDGNTAAKEIPANYTESWAASESAKNLPDDWTKFLLATSPVVDQVPSLEAEPAQEPAA